MISSEPRQRFLKTIYYPHKYNNQSGRRAWYFPDTDALLAALLTHLRPGDVVLIMSNGGFDGLIPRLCQSLEGQVAK
jgi:UDP-N-acetylmuramate-alanine ligase